MTDEPEVVDAIETMADWVQRELDEVIAACQVFATLMAEHPEDAAELDGCEFTIRCLDMRRVLDIDGRGVT